MAIVTREWVRLAAAWAAFVFIPFNLFAGILIAKEFTSSEAVAGLFFGSIALCLLTVPPILYASITGRTYAAAIEAEISNNILATLLKLLVPVVNIGWFSIQTVAATQAAFGSIEQPEVMFLLYAGTAAIFVLGPIFGGYVWLYRFGAIGVLAMALGFITIVGSGETHEFSWATPAWKNVSKAGLFVLGTWIFSSTTCVMDVAREVRQPRTAVTAILVGTITADVSLMTIGFLYPEFTSRLIGETSEKGIFGILAATFVIIALWSTNDSNFYSTEKALHNLGVPTILTAGLVVVATAAIGVLIGDRFFSVIAPWLQAMGWIGIPLGLFWLVSYLKQRGNWKRDGG